MDPHEDTPGDKRQDKDGPAPPATRPEDDEEDLRRYPGLPYVMVAAALLGLGLGWSLDSVYGTSPFWLVVCVVLFLLVGLYIIFKDVFR